MELIVQFISMTPNTAQESVGTPGSDLQNLNQTPSNSGPIPGVVGGAPAPTTPTASGGVGMPHSPQRPAEKGLQLNRKQLALKILELKVATWLKWDLDALEKNLPVIMQLALLRDLCTISYGCSLSIPLPNDFDARICMLIPSLHIYFSISSVNPFSRCWKRKSSKIRLDHIPPHAAANATDKGAGVKSATSSKHNVRCG